MCKRMHIYIYTCIYIYIYICYVYNYIKICVASCTLLPLSASKVNSAKSGSPFPRSATSSPGFQFFFFVFAPFLCGFQGLGFRVFRPSRDQLKVEISLKQIATNDAGFLTSHLMIRVPFFPNTQLY